MNKKEGMKSQLAYVILFMKWCEKYAKEIIIKRIDSYKSFKRAVKRDYQNEYFMNLEKDKYKYLYKLTRLYKIRKSVFKQAKDNEQIMDNLGGNVHEWK